ncbi:hypothetical protein ABTD98_22870, partial [Acinetobacter baumannii]
MSLRHFTEQKKAGIHDAGKYYLREKLSAWCSGVAQGRHRRVLGILHSGLLRAAHCGRASLLGRQLEDAHHIG